jgi:hypothetical protein
VDDVCGVLLSQILSQAAQLNINHYDIRAPCLPDQFHLCYKFTPLFNFVNDISTMHKLGMRGASWTPCNMNVYATHMVMLITHMLNASACVCAIGATYFHFIGQRRIEFLATCDFLVCFVIRWIVCGRGSYGHMSLHRHKTKCASSGFTMSYSFSAI